MNYLNPRCVTEFGQCIVFTFAFFLFSELIKDTEFATYLWGKC